MCVSCMRCKFPSLVCNTTSLLPILHVPSPDPGISTAILDALGLLYLRVCSLFGVPSALNIISMSDSFSFFKRSYAEMNFCM